MAGVLLVASGSAWADPVNVLRLPETVMNNSYQWDYSGYPATNLTDGITGDSYPNNWFAEGYGNITYRLGRLYDMTTFTYWNNTDSRVLEFNILAGAGATLSFAAPAYTPTPTPTPISTRRGGYVGFRPTSLGAGFLHSGGTELEVYGAPTDYLRIANPTIQSNYAAYPAGDYYAVSQVLDDAIIGSRSYASSGGGTSTFIVFDFGSPTLVSAVEIWDRGVYGILGAQLVFSDDLIFGDAGDVTEGYTKAEADLTSLVDLSPAYGLGVTKRYVKWQVTAPGTDLNPGMSEIAFYAVPEPASFALLGLVALVGRFLFLRRR